MNGLARSGSASTSVGREAVQELSLSVWTVVVVIGLVVVAVNKTLASWAEDLERRHNRAELLAAYRRRHDWKKGDFARLKSLNVNASARQRMERLAGRGRPVVKPHQPLEVTIIEKLSAFTSLVDPEAAPAQRRLGLKMWPWWPHFVEALYRGEHVLAKERRLRNPAQEAEILVGRALGISSATVHAICGDIRSMRRDDADSANFPSMTLAEYEDWMTTGTRSWNS
jgi:hypothetical protein